MPIRRVRWELVVILLALTIAGGFALGVWLELREGARLRPENLLKAEQFKGELDRDVAAGSTLAAVEEYLRGKPVEVTRSMGYDDKGRSFVRELKILIVKQPSPMFDCGSWSIGVDAIFVNDRLQSTSVSEWSWDCV